MMLEKYTLASSRMLVSLSIYLHIRTSKLLNGFFKTSYLGDFVKSVNTSGSNTATIGSTLHEYLHAFLHASTTLKGQRSYFGE